MTPADVSAFFANPIVDSVLRYGITILLSVVICRFIGQRDDAIDRLAARVEDLEDRIDGLEERTEALEDAADDDDSDDDETEGSDSDD